MAINPLIPLATTGIDLAPAGNAIAQGIVRDRQEQRQSKIDAENQKLRDLQMQVEQYKLADEQQKASIDSMVTGAALVKPMVDSGNLQGAISSLQQRKEQLDAAGVDSSDTDRLIQLAQSDIQAFNDEINSAVDFGYTTGRLQQGKSVQTFEDVVDQNGNLVAQRNIVTKELKPVDLGGNKESNMAKYSVSTEQYPNGTVSMVNDKGESIVKDPQGKIVTGEERTKVLQEAFKARAEQKRLESGGSEAGKTAIQASSDAFEQLRPVKETISNIDEAIAAIDNGANTGPIMSRLPSFNQASIQLDNAQARLGLNVISQTTFGALSEGELRLALSTAVPSNLEPEALREWLVKKKESQQKLAQYIEDAAIFLGTPGNTISDWLKLQKEKRESGNDDSSNASDGEDTPTTRIKYDAQGNRIE